MTREDAENAWPRLELQLRDEFNIAVYTRSVTNKPRQSGWGATSADGDWTIVLGIDLKENDPKAAQLPIQVSSADGARIPVRYYSCGPISKQTP
jgi:hypothetical protein